MAEPKVHINAPTYSTKEVLEIVGLTQSALYKAIDVRDVSDNGELYWPEVAKLVVAMKLYETLPEALKGANMWARLSRLVMAGPTPRAGTALVKADNSVYYLSTGLTSNHQGLSVKWDGTLKT